MPSLLSIASLVILASAPEPTADAPAPVEGAAPLDAGEGEDDAPALPPAGATPLDHAPGDGGTAWTSAPLGDGPELEPSSKLPPRTARMVRVDVRMGLAWRTRVTEALLTTSVEYGRAHGVSGSFHTSAIISIDPDEAQQVRVVDFPIGLGAVLQGRLKNRALYGSLGLTGGILVHWARTPSDVIRRVDPDIRLPIRLAWTARHVGLSVVLVQGYSVRSRTYELRGVPVWSRSAYRIGVQVGLHFDVVPKRDRPSRSRSRRAKKDKS